MIRSLSAIDEMVLARRGFAERAQSVGLVATMGALHDGHLSLIARAARTSDEVVISIFVNPLQFANPDDFSHYPRQLERDLEIASNAGASVVFAPSEEQMFPFGRPLVTIDPGPYGALLEGASRPGHMRGVATIVTKLFNIVCPDRAFFGEKDFEQLILVRQLVRDLGLDIEVAAVPIVREADGLAMSSRNQRLNELERVQASVLYRAISRGAQVIDEGCDSLEDLEREMADVVAKEPGVVLDYATARMSDDLSVPTRLKGSLRLLIAAKVGPVRLIDNLAIEC
ncbi:MAG TPA: pantoate--beta-alanine ligase [Acidimicrobiales bacterium]|nr:pantoate--beta-alanine ligase [Acidimicrobiales bacterium]